MKLARARVQYYRSIIDSGWFEVESGKTILVGANEAGKSAILQALQKINAPAGVKGFDPLRDYPRAIYNDISKGNVKPSDVTVVTAEFALDDDDRAAIPNSFCNATYVVGRRLDNTFWHFLGGAPTIPKYGDLKKDLLRLASHMDNRMTASDGGAVTKPSDGLATIVAGWMDEVLLVEPIVKPLREWLDKGVTLIDEANEGEEARLDRLRAAAQISDQHNQVGAVLQKRIPIFVLYNNYFRVRPTIHLGHLAERIASGVLDDDQYDYGNTCLLKLLGFTAKELSDLGRASEPKPNDPAGLQRYRDQLDGRSYQLNAASVKLTSEIRSVWMPDPSRAEADRLRIVADGQYLKVVVEDDLGVEVELDQRSEGFQWLVSFFVVFFAEAEGQNRNAVLLLDEPGLSLHGLKQRDFRETISRLAAANQTLYTTHSPFLVGPGELDMVRVVEMMDRKVGTKVHSQVIANDPAALLPLQEALGYDLAQSLFAQSRNLILEGLTDYWYLEATATLLREAGIAYLNEKMALVPANTAGKVVYFATILHAHKLKVAALLDSDSSGDQAANQDVLVHTLGNKRILRTKDYSKANVAKAEVEDLLRHTLVAVAKHEFSWNVEAEAGANPTRPIVDIFSANVPGFSKYKLAKAFLRWARDHEASDLTAIEREEWSALIQAINAALK